MMLRPLLLALLLCAFPLGVAANNSLHTTYLWHLHQPIYWPDQDRNGGAADRYETAWPSIIQTDGGAAHPENNLREIFGKDDRVAAYQWRTRDSIGTILGHSDAGAQINYSGALMENVEGLGGAGQLGYSGGWANAINEANGWATSGGHSRADIVNFSHHHAMLPLVSERTQWLQIRLHQEMMQRVWGIAPGDARGFFPTETCFSRRLIPVLEDLGIEWSFVSNEHLSRACPDFPLVLGSGGVNCDPPNLADQINPPGVNYWSDHIDRGCSPTNAYPFAYTPHRARHIDPSADPASLQPGDVSEIVVVPTAQAISWDDGYGSIGANALDGIAGGNDPSRPMLVVLAHDGDNAWGGGYSYYMEAVQNFVNDVASRGHSPSTVNEYLQDHPVPANDIVHVEDGGWVNADSDFGSPVFINWLYPLITQSGVIDPADGWHYKAREYAIFTAAENRIRTAENLQGGLGTTSVADILDSDGGSSPVERAWAYYLASMDSGNVYYGNPLDMEIKGTVGCNEAMEHIDPILATMAPAQDTTEPTVFVPQRHPYNPGSVSFGSQYGYQQFINDGSFEVWTFAHDVSGIQSATLHYRLDADGANPLSSWQNETYIGGAEVGAWQGVPMTQRSFPKDNPYNWGGLENYAFELPTHIADHFHADVPAFNEQLVDYYVEVIDAQGNVARTEIQHVWIGDGSGANGGGSSRVSAVPDPPIRGQSALVQFDPVGGPLDGQGTVNIHYGFNSWDAGPGTDAAMAWNASAERWEKTLPMRVDATQFDCVFNNGAGTWDNNAGQDWHLAVAAQPTPPTANFVGTPTGGAAPLAVSFTDTSAGGPTTWAWDFDNDTTIDGTQRNPIHTYTSAGTYTVSLTAMNASGSDTLTRTDYVTVTEPATDAELTLSRSAIDAQATVGTDAPNEMFTVTNTGAGTLAYSLSVDVPDLGVPDQTDVIAHLLGDTASPAGLDLNADGVVDIADAIHAILHPVGVWLSAAPLGGSSAGEADPITASFDSDALPVGTHRASIEVSGNAPNAPQTIDVTLTIEEESSVPGETTIVPNPPTAGQDARVWYVATGGPIAGATQITLHWGINGGLAAGGAWENVTDTPMAESEVSGTWHADIAVPANATTLNFVTNNGSGTWDNNGGQDWNFAASD